MLARNKAESGNCRGREIVMASLKVLHCLAIPSKNRIELLIQE